MAVGHNDVSHYLPLTSVSFEILLALADTERHGYAVMQEVERRTEGVTSLRPGTLYRAINRLLESGLIEESHERPAEGEDDERRRYYRLTTLGRDVASAEAARLAAAVESARDKKLLQRNA